MKRDKPAAGLGTDALERILDVTRKLAAPFDLKSMLSEVIDAGRTVLHADRGTVFLYEAETDELVMTVATGMESVRFPADRGIVGECAKTRAPVNVPDCYADDRFNRAVDRETGYHTRCLLSLPLIGYDDALVGVLQLINKHDGVFDDEDERIASTLAAQCAVALQRVKMTAQLVLKEKADREMAVARDVQMATLPSKMPDVAGYDLAGKSVPADETGGDTFDIVRLDEQRLMLLLGDATGHGIGPALSATQVRAMLRVSLRLGADLNAAFRHINDQLVEDLAENRFVTVFMGTLDTEAHRVQYHAGGQGPVMHFRAATGEFEWYKASTFPMGLFEQDALSAAESVALEPGDILGLITDGLYEYENPQGEQFGEEAVAELVREHQHDPMERLMQVLYDAVKTFGKGTPQGDDVTMVLVRRLPL